MPRSALAVAPAPWAPAAPIRRYVRYLMAETGAPWRVVARQAGVPAAAVRTLVCGRRGRLRPKFERGAARQLLDVTVGSLTALRHRLVSARATAEALAGLAAAGSGPAAAARLLGVSEPDCRRLADGRQWYCSAWVEALAVAARAEYGGVAGEPGAAGQGSAGQGAAAGADGGAAVGAEPGGQGSADGGQLSVQELGRQFGQFDRIEGVRVDGVGP
ncbi:MAG: hypothetical protein LBH76_08930 [Propionibacteriaceae bacterium]|nr:hypothetical protein [Propionibacteriaceae bacterium]